MQPGPSPRIWRALLCFFVCFNVVLAGVARPLPRQDDASTTAATVSQSATEDAASSSTSASADSTAVSVMSSSSVGSSVSTTADSTSSSTPAVTGGTGSFNTTLFNVTIPDGELPLKPQITPGYSVAGVILILTGIAYTLVGIKSRWLHCFFSVAYLAALGVTLLIVYVMDPPINNAVQGAFVVAAVGTGALLGGGGLVFKDITECLGCLLGGFCLSMWILTLKEGGVLGSGGAGVIIFTAVMSGAGFLGYFSHWTRSYYMIVCISLGGATAIVLGIDCFSRAGLKEFWAWIWDLNDDLFPRGADTYPLTKGIKVEQALTILLAAIGVISQMKLWRIIREHRAKKEDERARNDAANQEYETAVGRDIQSADARERRQWEAVYGDPKSSVSVDVSPDSGVGDLDSEDKRRNSGTTTTATTTRHSTINGGDGIEMAAIPIAEEIEGNHWAVVELDGTEPESLPEPKKAAEKGSGKYGGGRDTIHVAVDEVDGNSSAVATEGEMQASPESVDDEARLVPRAPTKQSRSRSGTPTPNIASKEPDIETNARNDDRRSSMFVMADEDGELLETRSTGSNRSSFAKRLSTGSVDLFRRLSQHHLRKQLDAAAHDKDDSMEETACHPKDDNESVAATFDDCSDGGDNMAMTPLDGPPFSMEIKAELAENEAQSEEVADLAKDAPETTMTDEPVPTEPVSDKQDGEQKDLAPGETENVSETGKPIATEAEPVPASLTRDRLPHGLSRAVSSHRTNEWAKHLSNAEIPPPEERRIAFAQEALPEGMEAVEERAAPVNVRELRKTAANATPPPAMPRSASVMSTRSANMAAPVDKSSNKVSVYSHGNASAARMSQGRLSQRFPADPRRASGRVVEAIAEEDDNGAATRADSRTAARRAAAAALAGEEATRGSPSPSDGTHAAARPVSSRPPVRGVVSYNSPQTLIGKRDMFMRAKNAALRPESGQVGVAGSSSPDTSAAASDAGSVRDGAHGVVAALGPPSMSNSNATGSGTNSRRNSESDSRAVDPDDLPLSQRKAFIRQDSMASAATGDSSSGVALPHPRRSSLGNNSPMGGSRNSLAAPAAFNSHQPQRGSNKVQSQAARDSQLASFRQSVQQDLLRAAPAGAPAVNANANLGHGGGYRLSHQGPLINSVYGIPGTSSTNALSQRVVQQSPDSEVQRDIDMQRHFLMSQKQAEAQKRETLRNDKELAKKRMEERMRSSSDMIEMHRQAMRRIQRTASQADQRQQ